MAPVEDDGLVLDRYPDVGWSRRSGDIEFAIVGVLYETVVVLEPGKAAQAVSAEGTDEGDDDFLRVAQGHRDRSRAQYDAPIARGEGNAVGPVTVVHWVSIEGEERVFACDWVGVGDRVVDVGLGLEAAQQVVPLLGTDVGAYCGIVDGAAGGEIDERAHRQVAITGATDELEQGFTIRVDDNGPLEEVVADGRRRQRKRLVTGILLARVIAVAQTQ